MTDFIYSKYCKLTNIAKTHLDVILYIVTFATDLGRQGSSESGEGNWSLDNNKSSGEDDLMTSSLDMGSFEQVTRDMCQETSLYIFARSDREKDDWYVVYRGGGCVLFFFFFM